MQLHEYIKTNGLFEHLLRRGFLSKYPLIQDGQTWNELITFKYGDRILVSKLSLSTNTLSTYIDMLYSEKWTDLLAANKVSPLVDDTNTVQETIVNSITKANTGESLNKVSAYDSDVLINDDGNSITSNEVADGETVRTMTDTNTNHANQYLNITNKQKNNIVNTILYDVADAITLSVY